MSSLSHSRQARLACPPPCAPCAPCDPRKPQPGGNQHTYFFLACFGVEERRFGTERKALRWLTECLGRNPAESIYWVRETTEGGTETGTVYLSPEIRMAMGDDFEEPDCIPCDDENQAHVESPFLPFNEWQEGYYEDDGDDEPLGDPIPPEFRALHIIDSPCHFLN